jgi:hypothetical protein
MAIATESGYGAFLPTYENEFVNREALRGQMVKQASYLTEMDTIYAQLEEQARQFDVGLEASTEKWKAELEEKSREFDSNLELGWAQQATNSYSAHSTATNQATQISNQQSQYDTNLAWEQEQYSNQQSTASDLYDLITGTSSNTNSYSSNNDYYSNDANFQEGLVDEDWL